MNKEYTNRQFRNSVYYAPPPQSLFRAHLPLIVILAVCAVVAVVGIGYAVTR